MLSDGERNKWDGSPRRDEVRATQYVFAAFLVFVLVFAGLTLFAYQATREADAPCARVPGHALEASGCKKTDHIKMENPMLSMGSIKHHKWKSSVVIAGSFLGICVVGTVLWMANRKIRSSSPPRQTPMNYDGVMVDLDIKAWFLLSIIVLTLFGIGSYMFAKLGWDAAAAIDPNADGGYAGARSGRHGMANPLQHLVNPDGSKYSTPSREIFGKDTEGSRFFGNAGPNSILPDHNEHGEVFGSQDTWQKISPWSERSMQADLANDVARYESAQVAHDINPMSTMVNTPSGPAGGAAHIVTADHVGPQSATVMGLVEEKAAASKQEKPQQKSALLHQPK